ncbi:MAG TPA: hypothetical protein VKE95_12530 [Burkholderiales bacterium]|nr:hypothetical protein [Burkholderiales bacterium]
MPEIHLLLTATIHVRSTALTARVDPQQRLADYAAALAFWLRVGGIERIVFCENSGADLAPLQRAAARLAPDRQVEWLGFTGAALDPARGKGLGEAQIIEHALAKSKALSGDGYVLKATGRYTVPNIAHVLPRTSAVSGPDVICNLHENLARADSRLFFATPAFLARYLLPRCAEIDDSRSVFLEHVLARAVLRAVSEGLRWELPRQRPDIRGVSGTWGGRIGSPFGERQARAAVFRLRRLLLQR